MLNAHYDTVGVDEMPEPFSAAVRDGKLYGRGAYDMKGSLAACMTAAKALADAGAPQAGDVLVAAVADEEYGSLGTASVIANVKVDGAIVTEPTSLKICLAHKGYLWIEVETTGRAAHGSRFNEGVDANMRMGRFLGELDQLEQELRARSPHPLVGTALAARRHDQRWQRSQHLRRELQIANRAAQRSRRNRSAGDAGNPGI